VPEHRLAQHRALRLTALYLGGPQALSEFLGVPQGELAEWLSAKELLPPPVMTRVAEFLLELLTIRDQAAS
jgi:hypothetical protein